jgi:hypothetical protein
MNWLDMVGGYAIEQEDRDYLRATAISASYASAGDIPERVDPRRSPLATQGWLKVENQGSIGSCQGNALSECAEFCHAVETGEVIQISRMAAYILSQMPNNIRRDGGSTLQGGTVAAKNGLPLEADAPYPSSYPGWGYITDEIRAKCVYKLRSHVDIKSAVDGRAFIGSGIGILQIGVSWGRSFEPDSKGCIRNFYPGNGGHSVTLTGYVPDADVGQQSGAGYWFLLKNSWGTRWGVNGFAYVSPSAVDQMLRHQWTVIIGRSDMESPRPRPIPIDFTRQSLFS